MASIALYGATLDNLAADSISLASISRLLGHSTDAIIGTDLFSKYVVEVDYLGRKLRLYDPDSYINPKGGCQLPLFLDTYPKVQAQLIGNDEKPIDILLALDTGSNYLVLTKLFGDAHPNLPLTGKTVEAAPRKLISGVTPIRLGRVRAIKLGGCVVEKPIAAFLQDVGGPAPVSQELLGTIGMNILQDFTTVFDYRHHLVTFLGNGSGGVPEYDMTGIHILTNAPPFHDFTVDYVLGSSPAARAGIQIGDKIEKANHVPAAQLTLDDLDKMFKRRGSLRLRISRDGKYLDRKLKLKPIL